MERNIPDSMKPSFERTSHPFYMWDELMKTPEALETVFEQDVQTVIANAAARVQSVDEVHLIGCGTSYFSAIAGQYAFHSIAGIRAHAHNAFEFSAYPPVGLDKSAVLAISHTGGTGVVLDSVKLGQQSGAVTIGLTDVDDSPLASAAAFVVKGGGGREKQLPKTRSYVSSLLKHYLLAAAVALQADADESGELTNLLQSAPSTARRVIEDSQEQARIIAQSLSREAKVCLFGGGPHVASAMEGALKLQESVQAAAYGFELEEGMHGPWVTMNAEDLVIVYAVSGPSFDKATKFIEAISAVGARIWVLTDAQTEIAGATYRTQLPQVPEMFSPLYGTLPIYHFTYELALARGVRADVMRLDDERYLDARLKLPR